MRWYHTLNKDSNSLLNREELGPHSFVVCRQLQYRNFAMFYDYLEYAKHSFNTPIEGRCFYEVIFGDRPQKIYFDIDTSTDEISFEEAEERVIFIREELRLFLLEITNSFSILIFTSFGDSKKISYHIVVDGIGVMGNKQNAEIYRRLIERVGEKGSIIDSKVYKPIQQFRIWECCKFGETSRIKTLSPLSITSDGQQWIPNCTSEKKYYTTLLKSSLVSQVEGLKILPPFEIPEVKREYFSGGVITLDESVAEKAFALYRSFHSVGRCPFTFQEIIQDEESSGMILCHRHSPSFCKKCERIHENENPFFLIWGEEMNVSFYCRRCDEGLFIGSIKVQEQCEKVEEEPPETPKIKRSGIRELMKNVKGRTRVDIPRDLEIELKRSGKWTDEMEKGRR